MTDLEAEREARAGLTRVVEPSTRLPDDIHSLPVIEQWTALLDGQAPGLAPWRDLAASANPQRDLERIEEAGGRFVIPGDPEWPEQLGDLHGTALVDYGIARQSIGTPYGLWVRGNGDLAELTRHSIALVGSRACTPYGETVAAGLAAGLVGKDYRVISGGAYGIDAAAHRGAMNDDLCPSTVAVLACGADMFYPRANEAMFERIVVGGGLVVSETPPGFSVTRKRFLMRNRIVAAMSRATVVVESGIRSGTMNTVGWAEQLGRLVLAVPGPITSAASIGPNNLIHTRRATAVVSVQDILEVLG